MTTDNSAPESWQTCKRMVLLLAAACVVGFTYNWASPLGVRIGSKRPHAAAPAVLSASVTNLIWQDQKSGAGPEADSPFPGEQTARIMLVSATPRLTWPQTRELLAQKQIVLVDARSADYYQTEHIPGAISLPAGSAKAELAAFAAKYPEKNTPLVVYCNSARCPLARQLARILRTQWGYTNVREMHGGMAEYWREESRINKAKPK